MSNGVLPHRSAGVARAWRLGTQLAHLVTNHHLGRPARVKTHIWRGEPIDGYVDIEVRLASIADLLRLAYATDQDIRACPGVGQQMQGYIHVGPAEARICASWATQEPEEVPWWLDMSKQPPLA